MNNEWIPVSERLPDKEGYYLISLYNTKDKTTNVLIERFCKLTDPDWDTYFDFLEYCVKKPIHEGMKKYKVEAWMELPTPYENPTKEIKIIFEVPKWTTENGLINFIKDKINIDDTYITSLKLEE